MLPRTTAAAAVLFVEREGKGKGQKKDAKKKTNTTIKIKTFHNSSLCLPQGPGTSGNDLLATTAFPDTNGSAADGITTAEAASVLGVLGGFDLLHLLTDGATVAGTVLTDNSNFLGALGLSIVERTNDRQNAKGQVGNLQIRTIKCFSKRKIVRKCSEPSTTQWMNAARMDFGA